MRAIRDAALALGFAIAVGLSLAAALVSIALFGFKPEEGP